jgi:hypothetical protein
VKTTALPALIYRVGCTGCRGAVEIPVFDGGGFYGFVTYRGPATGRFYRVDLDRIFYLKLVLDTELERAARQFEGGAPLELVPDGMRCPTCGEPVGLAEAELCTLHAREQQVAAVLL